MKRLLFAFSAIPFLCACVQVPMTTINVPTANGVVTIRAPKDSKILGLKADFVNGTVSLDSYEAKMNPDVIGASAAGQVELIKGYSELANSLGQLGIRAFATSQGIPIGGAPAAQTQPAPSQSTTITQDQLNAIIQKRAEALANQIVKDKATNAPPSIP